MKVTLPDASGLELPSGATGLDAARAIGPRLAKDAVLARVNGEPRDLRLPLADGDRIEILTSRDRHDPDALFVLRHSTAHLLAEAVKRLYPGTRLAIGPPIESGFYYDFEFPQPLGEEVLAALEQEIRRQIAEGRNWEREQVEREEARQYFAERDEPYKLELVDSAEGAISLYRQGDFVDLCRGPHLQDARPIKAVKLLSLAGAYWRGDADRPQLTRVYGTAFYSQDDLDEHLRLLEQARRRDHRRLGRELGLFQFSELAPGMAFWQPKGMVVWNVLEDLRRAENSRRGYLEVRTPLLYDVQLWHSSGHWDHYRESMFVVSGVEERTYSLKPMNCPGHCLLYGEAPRSYRELPLRLAEAGPLHRYEPSGTLHGLLRVRHFHQDDAHIYCTQEQIEEEVLGCLDFAHAILVERFGFDLRVELSTRPEKRLGGDGEWDLAEAALASALGRAELEYTVNEGDGAFYGPKIDYHMRDSLGRSWQLGTVQLDFQMPQRFGLSYIGPDNAQSTPVMIHRAVLGSLERFLGILLEHTGGDLPLWLAPIQARVLPVAEAHRPLAHEVLAALKEGGIRADLDERDETLAKRIRDAELEKIPTVAVIGTRESRQAVAVRRRGGAQETLSLAGLVDELRSGARL